MSSDDLRLTSLTNALGEALDEFWKWRLARLASVDPDSYRARVAIEGLTVPGWLSGDRDALLLDDASDGRYDISMMNLKKMKTPSGAQEWPNGIGCSRQGCGIKIAPGDAVLAGRERTQGSVVFHKGCIIGLVQSEWPESRYDEIRQSIIESPAELLT